MTIYAFEAQESWLPTVIGMSCTAIDYDYEANALTLSFNRAGYGAESGSLEAERMISLSGVWRLEQEDEVLAASGDVEDPERQAHLERLTGRELVRVDVSHPGYDLVLHLTGPYIVRCFPCDSLQFGEDPPDDDVYVSWWVDGVGVPQDWEEPNEAFFSRKG
ncbi:hypothetical protein BH23CHL2_BH23CHL2_24860 [soil metagenome]